MYESKKAQAAMEFLMTYGWAILVVLIAIGALAYFGVLNPDRFLPEKCVLATGSGLFCNQHSATASDNTITFRIQNILTEEVTVFYIDVNATGETCVEDTSFPENGATIAADGTTDFVYGVAANPNSGVGCTDLASGDKIKGDLIVLFYTTGPPQGLNRVATGQLVTTAS